jgi:hypothetical protein
MHVCIKGNLLDFPHGRKNLLVSQNNCGNSKGSNWAAMTIGTLVQVLNLRSEAMHIDS